MINESKLLITARIVREADCKNVYFRKPWKSPDGKKNQKIKIVMIAQLEMRNFDFWA